MKFESIREIIVEIYLRTTLKLFTKLKKNTCLFTSKHVSSKS